MKLFKGTVINVDKEGKEWKNEKAVIVGRLTRDPFIGPNSAAFTVATLGKDTNVEFIKVVVTYEKTRDFIEKYVTKGCTVAVIGNITKEEFDRKDGTKGEQEVIFSDNLQLVSFPYNKDGVKDVKDVKDDKGTFTEISPATDEDDLPF